MLEALISGEYYSRVDNGKKIRKSFKKLKVKLKDPEDKKEIQDKAKQAVLDKYDDALSIRTAKIDKIITD